MAVKSERDVKWLDGIRGIASLTVVLTHLSRTFDGGVFFPSPEPDAFPRLNQLPFIRVLFQGRFGVTVFSLLTSYVCALKPLRQIRSSPHSPEAALSTISRAAFRRIPRLVLPAAIATVISWVMAQCGAYALADRVDAFWLFSSAPQRSESVGQAIMGLVRDGLLATWTRDGYNNYYDINQWTMMPLLKVSMFVFGMLSAGAYLRPKARMTCAGLLMVFWFLCRDFQFGMQAAYGLLLCDLSQHPAFTSFMARRSPLHTLLSVSLVTFGLFLASYPEIFPEWTTWSHTLQVVADALLPFGSDVPRFYTCIGTDIFIIGLLLSPSLKEILSHWTFLWLGKNSFAVYLLHGPLLRSVLVWMVWAGSVPPYERVRGEDGNWLGPPRDAPQPSWVTLAFCIPLWLVGVYACAEGWTNWVEPVCAKVTKRLEQWAGEDGEKSGPGTSGSLLG